MNRFLPRCIPYFYLSVSASLFLAGLFQPPGRLAAQDPSSRSILQESPFFAFCFDTHDAQKRNLSDQTAMLKQLGYAGAGHLWLDGVEERLATLDEQKLKLFQIYLQINLSQPDRPYDERLEAILPKLQGRDAMLAVLIVGGGKSDESLDPAAVDILRSLADKAKPFGVRIVLYHHIDQWLDRFEDALRVAEKVDRENVGVMFNWCHWCKRGQLDQLAPLLERSKPRLMAVSINGGAGWEDIQAGRGAWIAPLDQTSDDLRRLLAALDELGYAGPIGLQCWGIGGDAREHLGRSIDVWRSITEAKPAP